MYNRYVPQPDGSFRRNRMQESQRSPQSQTPSAQCEEPHRPPRPKATPSAPLGSFFRQLLPADFSAEDLLIVVLLMLMSGDSEEGRSSALLTLAFYLFL